MALRLLAGRVPDLTANCVVTTANLPHLRAVAERLVPLRDLTIKFSMTQPIYYQYNYKAGSGYVAAANPAVPNANGFEAAAVGDLDGDASNSVFARTGQVNTGTRQLIVSTQVYIENEYE